MGPDVVTLASSAFASIWWVRVAGYVTAAAVAELKSSRAVESLAKTSGPWTFVISMKFVSYATCLEIFLRR